MRAVNLIPTDQRRVEASGKQSGSAYVVLGVLVTLLAMVAAYVFTANNVTDRQNKTAAAKAEADRLEAQAAQHKDFTNFAQIKQLRLASVTSIAETRFDWERLMHELARVMPSGSWLQTSDASVTGDVAGGESTAAAATTTTATVPEPKANLTGCTPNQSDVARMMVRMRELYRVSDVELNESAREAGASEEASVESCGSYYHFDVTVTFEAARPASEAPRGESAVPASLGGGS